MNAENPEATPKEPVVEAAPEPEADQVNDDTPGIDDTEESEGSV